MLGLVHNAVTLCSNWIRIILIQYVHAWGVIFWVSKLLGRIFNYPGLWVRVNYQLLCVSFNSRLLSRPCSVVRLLFDNGHVFIQSNRGQKQIRRQSRDTFFNKKISQDCHPRNTSDGSRQGSNKLIESLLEYAFKCTCRYSMGNPP